MKTLRNFLAIVINGVLPLVAIPINNYLVLNNISPQISLIVIVIASISISIFSYFVFPNLLFNAYFIRWIFEPLAKFEGTWVQIVCMEANIDSRVCGFFTFEYDRHDKNYVYKGSNYNIHGVTIITFSAPDIQYKKEFKGLRFFGKAIKSDFDVQPESIVFGKKINSINPITTRGEIIFSGSGGRRINSATGFFINDSSTPVRAKYDAIRADNDWAKFKSENAELDEPNQRAKYAVSYYEKYKESLKDL